MNSRIAMCIPTFNHRDLIKELLCEYADQYAGYGIDIYIYDSGNDDTHAIVDDYDGSCAVYYRDVSGEVASLPSTMHGNYKVFLIYRDLCKDSRYDYVWVCGDRIRIRENVLNELMVYLSKGQYDYVTISNSFKLLDSGREYTNPKDYFEYMSWIITLFGATLVRRETVLDSANIEGMIARYVTTETVNYSHVCFYAERALEISDFHAYVIITQNGGVENSALSLRNTWRNDIFTVLFDYWPKAIEKLPDLYDKKKIIESYYDINVHFNRNVLIGYIADGIFTPEVFYRHPVEISKIADMDVCEVEEILKISREEANDYICGIRNKIRDFFDSHNKIYLYGAGRIGKRYVTFLRNEGLDKKIEGFVVSSMKNNKRVHCGLPVSAIGEIDRSDNPGLFMCLSKRLVNELKATILKDWNDEDIYSDDFSILF